MYTTITIDGTSGAGKSTVARTLSKEYNIPCLHAGAMFRTLAHKARSYFPNTEYTHIDIDTLLEQIASSTFTLLHDKGSSILLYDNTPLPGDVNTEEIAEVTAHIASHARLRHYVRTIQQHLAQNTHLIAEGRDMGTVVFPDADVKIFLTADVEERAKRRYLELKEEYPDIEYDDVIRQMMHRDDKDYSRVHSPLSPAKDAIVVDTTEYSLEEVVNILQNYIESKKLPFLSCTIKQ